MSQRTEPGTRVRRSVAWVVMAAVLSVVGCDDGTGPDDPEPDVASVTVEPAALSLQVGDTATLRAIVRAADGATLTRAVAWRSADEAKATVTTGGLVTARAAGPVDVTATVNGRSGRASVTVEPLQPSPTISLVDPAEVHAGGPPLTLRVYGANFQPDARVQWNGSARPSVRVTETEVRATITAEDVAAVGTAEVLVVNPNGGASAPATFRITVQPEPVSSLAVHPALAYTTVGSAVILGSVARNAAGAPLTGRYVTYASDNHLVATVDGNGLIRPMGVGEVVITARSEGVESTSIIRVTDGEFHHLLASDGVGLTTLDLRVGTPPTRIWENWPGSRAIDPSPSPDGRHVAYVIESGVRRHLAVFDRVNRTYLFVSGPEDDTYRPAGSPAGDRIAFRSAGGGRSHIYTVRPDGTGLVHLTADLPATSGALDPAWSPDGSRLVFAVQSDPGFWGLMTMNSDGSGKRPLTGGAVDIQPAWIGDVVVFTRRDPFGTATDIWRTSVSGLGPLMPLTSTGSAHSPTLSPDHGWIAYIEGAQQRPGAIMAMRPFGEDARPIFVPGPGMDAAMTPVWLVRR